jgi:flagellar hook-associated protein 3 FlgL
MRVTQNLNQLNFVSALNTLEANLSQTQNQLSTNLSFTTPSQNPVAAGAVNNYDQALAQSKQYDTNANSAQTSLSTEDSALSQVQTALQSLRDLALQANSGTLSATDRAAIAVQATQIQASLVSLANTQDGNGQYIFGGFATQTPPFSQSATGATTYNGDQGQRQAQIAAGQYVTAGDNGDAVFNQIKSGNGTFTATAGAGNTGTGLLDASTVSNPAAYDGKPYSIQFATVPATGTVANTYNIVDASGVTVTSGAYASGQTIAFDGLQVTLTGQPAIGDTFSVAPSANQSVFTTVQNLISALNAPGGTSTTNVQLSNSIAGAISNIDQALSQSSDVRAGVGARLNSITAQLSVSSSQQIQLQTSISSLQSLDYASAITKLDQQTTTLQASMQAYTLTQGLSLFKYLPAA